MQLNYSFQFGHKVVKGKKIKLTRSLNSFSIVKGQQKPSDHWEILATSRYAFQPREEVIQLKAELESSPHPPLPCTAVLGVHSLIPMRVFPDRTLLSASEIHNRHS